mgnify:CR=1 FL=1
MVRQACTGGVAIAFRGVEHAKAPGEYGYVRGSNHIGLLAIRSNEKDPSQSIMNWIFASDIKGWIPAAVVRASSSKFIHDAFAEVRVAAKRIREGWSAYSAYEADQTDAANVTRWAVVHQAIAAMAAAE